MNVWIVLLELFMKLLEIMLKRPAGDVTLDSGKKWGSDSRMAKAFEYSPKLKRLLAALGKRPEPPETLGDALAFLKSAKGKRWLAETF